MGLARCKGEGRAELARCKGKATQCCNITAGAVPGIADVSIMDEQLLVSSLCNHEPSGVEGRDHFRFLVGAINLCLAHISNGKESDMGL